MLDNKSLINLFTKTLGIKNKKLTIQTSMKDIPEWDSMAHLTLLFEINKVTKGKASKIKNLSKCTTIFELHKLLVKAKLAK
jgi:acyl carrier protein